jgi:hypothetical protein
MQLNTSALVAPMNPKNGATSSLVDIARRMSRPAVRRSPGRRVRAVRSRRSPRVEVRRRAVAPIGDLEIFASIEGVTSMVI